MPHRHSSIVRPKLNIGFTLIEAMVTVAIIGIIASVGWSYYKSEIKMRIRRDAVAGLTAISQQLESCRTDIGDYHLCTVNQVAPSANNTSGGGNHKCGMYNYNTATDETGQSYYVKSPDCHYKINVSINNADSYTLTASNILNNDQKCSSLSLDNLGRQGFQGTANSAHYCWGN